MNTFAVTRAGPEDMVKYFDLLGEVFGRMDSEKEADIFAILAEWKAVYIASSSDQKWAGAGQAPIFGLSLGALRKGTTVACVSALATLPQFRGMGVMRSIISHIKADAIKNEVAFLQLFADVNGLYGQLGFEPHGSYFSATVIEARPLYVRTVMKPIRSHPDTPLDVLHQIYDRKRRLSPGMLARDKESWLRQFHNRHAFGETPELQFIWVPEAGYILYRHSGGHVIVSETVLIDPSAWPVLWNDLIGMKQPSPTVTFRRLSAVDPLLNVLSAHRIDFTLEFQDTLYVTTGDPLIAARSLEWVCPGEYGFTITAGGEDRHLVISVGDINAATVSEVETAFPDNIRITEGAFARLALGGVSLHRLAAEGGARAEDEALRTVSRALSYHPDLPLNPQLL